MGENELPDWLRYLLLGFFGFGIIPLAVYGIYKQFQTGSKIAPRIQSELLDPYVRNLSSGDFSGALVFWAEGPDRPSPEDFAAAQEKLNSESGKPAEIQLVTIGETKVPGEQIFWDVRARRISGKNEDVINFDIVEIEGNLRIRNTYKHIPGSGSGTKRKMIY